MEMQFKYPNDEDKTIEQWICRRFCKTHNVHNWVHDRLLRALLFDTFSRDTRTLPSIEDVSEISGCIRLMRKVLVREVLDYVAGELIDITFHECWVKGSEEELDSDLELASDEILHEDELTGTISDCEDRLFESTEEDRGVLAFLSDAILIHGSETKFEDWVYEEVRSTYEVWRRFMEDPDSDFLTRYQPDTLSLRPPVDQTRPLPSQCETYPVLNSPCQCSVDSNCQIISECLSKSTYLRHDYTDALLRSRLRGCGAIKKLWDPLLTRAEEWFASLEAKMVCPAEMFPDGTGEGSCIRIGPVVLDMLAAHDLTLGSPGTASALTTALSLVSWLRYAHARPDDNNGALAPLHPCSDDHFGFLILYDYCDVAQAEDGPVLLTSGGWLEEFAETVWQPIADANLEFQWRSIYHIYDSQYLQLRIAKGLKFKTPLSVCFPVASRQDKPGGPGLAPGIHQLSEHNTHPGENVEKPAADSPVQLYLSPYHRSIFPLLSVADSNIDKHPNDALAVQLSTLFDHRLIYTWSCPDVVAGTRCPHQQAHGRQTRCAFTSRNILSQVEALDISLQTAWDEISDDATATLMDCKAMLGVLEENWRQRTSNLTSPGGPLERNRLTIILCGEDDGPANPIILLAASIGKRVYIISARECWHCACVVMVRDGFSIGLAIDVKERSQCVDCSRQRIGGNRLRATGG